MQQSKATGLGLRSEDWDFQILVFEVYIRLSGRGSRHYKKLQRYLYVKNATS